MSKLRIIRTAYAWRDESDQWHYAETRELAPEGAVEVKELLVDGKIVLWCDGEEPEEFIWGAVAVRG